SAIRRRGSPQNQSKQPRNQPPRHNYALPDQAGREHERPRGPKRRKKRDQSGFAHAHATLRQRQHRGELCQRPRKKPYTQRQSEATGDCEQRGKYEKGELDERTRYPDDKEIKRTTLYRTKGLAQTRQSTPQPPGAMLN